MTRALKLLRELVALPSVNPAFLPAGHARAGETRVAEYLATIAAHAGLDIEFQEVTAGRANLLARLSCAQKPRHRVLLAPHLDTVNGIERQFRPELKRGRLYGRGACDTKGSIAAMMSALLEVAKSGRRPEQTEIVFAGLVDEENGQLGSRKLAASRFRADLAIVGEPTWLKVVTAHKGSLWLRIETCGRAAHGSRPELGRNAVHEMSRIVDLLLTEYSASLKRKQHLILGCGTVSVGAIAGGSQANIVPDECYILVDRRTLPGETLASAWREIEQLLRRHKLEARLANQKLAPCDPMETDIHSPFVTQFLDANRQRAGAGVNYFCDAAVLAAGGIPSVVFGPGDIGHAHTVDEWVAISQLEGAHARLVRFLRNLP